MKKITKITQKQIAAAGVQALANRPNAPAQYGLGGLSPQQLKLHFDKLATLIAEKVNEIGDVIASEDAAQYFRIALDEYGIETLSDLIFAMQSGDLASNILQLFASVTDTEPVTLQQFANHISQALSDLAEEIDNAKNNVVPRLYTPTVTRAGEELNILVAVDDERNGFITQGYNVYLDGDRVSRCHKNPISDKTYIDLNEHIPSGRAGHVSFTAYGEAFGVKFDESYFWDHGHYINGVEFTVNGLSYFAGYDMTWYEWINSSISPKGFAFDDYGVPCINGSPICVGGTYTVVNRSDIIGEGQAYESHYHAKFILNGLHDGIISFDQNSTFDFVEGMTWADWKASPYNMIIYGGVALRFETQENGKSIIDVGFYPLTPLEGIGYSNGLPVRDEDHIDTGDNGDTYFLYDYDSYSSFESLNVTLESSNTSKILFAGKYYNAVILNGIDGLTDAVETVVDNGNGTITLNYKTNTDLDTDVYYTAF